MVDNLNEGQVFSENTDNIQDKRYVKCWCCDTLYHMFRTELHHIYGKVNNTTVRLCVLCHDLIDRMDSGSINVFAEHLKALKELDQLGLFDLNSGELKYTKIFYLRMAKVISINENHGKSKKINQ